MTLQMRPACLMLIALVTVSTASWGAATPHVTTHQPDPQARAANSTSSPPTQGQQLTLEERADIFYARKNYADAADYYFRALKQSSYKSPTLWNKLGIAYQVQTKYGNAEKAYVNALHVDRDFPEAWNNIGTVYCMEKRYGKSVKYYKRAIELMDNNASFHMNLGTSYYHMKKFDLAVQEYRTALGIDPKVMAEDSPVGTMVRTSGTGVEFYFYMAKAYASIGDADDAVRYLRRALEDGFTDSKKIDGDPDFSKISKYPAFVELMRNPPVAIKE